jgi:hypothetical protein
MKKLSPKEGTFVTGDILVECPFHKFITDQD